MNRNEQMKKDAEEIEATITKYNGPGMAHFGFIAHATGERMFWAGGNAALTGVCLAEAIAELIENTPGMDGDEFIRAITDLAKDILKRGGTVQ